MALKGDYKVSKTGYMVMPFIKIKNRDLLLLLWVLVYERDEHIISLFIYLQMTLRLFPYLIRRRKKKQKKDLLV